MRTAMVVLRVGSVVGAPRCARHLGAGTTRSRSTLRGGWHNRRPSGALPHYVGPRVQASVAGVRGGELPCASVLVVGSVLCTSVRTIVRTISRANARAIVRAISRAITRAITRPILVLMLVHLLVP